MLLRAAVLATALLKVVNAANAEDWRSRSIYQIITDRFAPPSDTAPARTNPLPEDCDPALQTWCGGTWLSIIDKLDYIQDMGFDSIWISPVGRNIDVETPYHYAYHGYWVNDPRVLNPRFGDEKDLHALVDALHKRNMYIMVDIVVNNVPALSIETANNPDQLVEDLSIWTDPAYFHPNCTINYDNVTSVENCWIDNNDTSLALMDVNTENEYVITTLQEYIRDFVSEYKIDGLRIDAAKHVPGVFWPGFCGAAGVFCIGEVFGDDIPFAAGFQTNQYMDSILGYPYYNGLYEAFSVAPKGNMSGLTRRASEVQAAFPDPGLLGNFLENHDVPRFSNTTADPLLAYNAMVAQFMFDGIPVVYYGQEQDMALGLSDPYNRAPLWPVGYENTTTVQRMTRLNLVRQQLIKTGLTWNDETYLQAHASLISSTAYDVAYRKGPLIYTVTNRGSPETGENFGISSTGWPRNIAVVDLLTCKEFITGAGGSLSVAYVNQGDAVPHVFATVEDAGHLGICTNDELGVYTDSPRSNGASALPVSVFSVAALSGTVSMLFL